MKTMIKKYKRIGALLLGLSCLTGGFFTTVENNSLIPTVQAAERTDKLPCNMSTKELFNVVYGYLREKGIIITFAMQPQNADDYGLITIYWNDIQYGAPSVTIQGSMFFNFYIDKGSSRDFSILYLGGYCREYNYVVDYTKYGQTEDALSTKFFYCPVDARDLIKYISGLENKWKEDIEEKKQTFYNDLSARVKSASSSTRRESTSAQRESAPVQNESTSAPSRSSRE
jgi:hypothetical protein